MTLKVNATFSTFPSDGGEMVIINSDSPVNDSTMVLVPAEFLIDVAFKLMGSKGAALKAVLAERIRQENKWGDQSDNCPLLWNAILGEEVGEVANAILEQDQENYPVELIQVAAVAVSAYEHYNGGRLR